MGVVMLMLFTSINYTVAVNIVLRLLIGPAVRSGVWDRRRMLYWEMVTRVATIVIFGGIVVVAAMTRRDVP